jgi:hypothetical protein
LASSFDKFAQFSFLIIVDFVSIGRLWVFLGALRFHLLIPAQPIDPTQKYAIRVSNLDRRMKEIQTEIDARRWMEKLFTGRKSNSRIEQLESSLERLGRVSNLYSVIC